MRSVIRNIRLAMQYRQTIQQEAIYSGIQLWQKTGSSNWENSVTLPAI